MTSILPENIGLQAQNHELKRQLEYSVRQQQMSQQQLEYMHYVGLVGIREKNLANMLVHIAQRSQQFLQANSCAYVAILKHEAQLKSQVWHSPKIKIQHLDKQKLIAELKQKEFECCMLPADIWRNQNDRFSLVISMPIQLNNQVFGCMLWGINDADFSVEEQISRIQTLENVRTIVSGAVKSAHTELVLKNRLAELHASNKALAETEKQLIRSERMAVIGQLAAGVAHEINNPIGYVSSNIESLDEYSRDLLTFVSVLDDKTKAEMPDLHYIIEDIPELLADTEKGLTRVKEIVAGLKTFSHINEETDQVFDLGQCVQDALLCCRNELKYLADVHHNLNDDLTIKGNRGQIEQVLINLFINAAHAMQDSNGSLTIVGYQFNDLVKLSITDTGCGMSEQTLLKIFDPFYTTKPIGQGTGLGLSIALNILEKHAGGIDIKSVEGCGTCITLQLPYEAMRSAQ
ncbi:sensor histidine kinase (plasmid) [Catenovulum sp. SX2]|uniref:sensor histidine kinase n=1 Tax=Catenovulum sp. SX2 TaxID=3398614 RepID=UPI003F82C949